LQIDALSSTFSDIYFSQNKGTLLIDKKDTEDNNGLLITDLDTLRILSFTLLNDYSAHGKLSSRDRAFSSFPIGVLLKGCNEGEDFEADKLNFFSQFHTMPIEDPEEIKIARVLHLCTVKIGSKLVETKLQVTPKVLFFSNDKILFFEKFCLIEEVRIEYLGEGLSQILLKPNKKNEGVNVYKFKRNIISKKSHCLVRIQLPNAKVYNTIHQSLRKQK
jgi:hypothetical protein